jgi:hypothetical protein
MTERRGILSGDLFRGSPADSLLGRSSSNSRERIKTPLDRAKTHPGAETMRPTQGDKMDIIIAVMIAVSAGFVWWLLVTRFRKPSVAGAAADC